MCFAIWLASPSIWVAWPRFACGALDGDRRSSRAASAHSAGPRGQVDELGCRLGRQAPQSVEMRWALWVGTDGGAAMVIALWLFPTRMHVAGDQAGAALIG